jgi:hypothetical protein
MLVLVTSPFLFSGDRDWNACCSIKSRSIMQLANSAALGCLRAAPLQGLPWIAWRRCLAGAAQYVQRAGSHVPSCAAGRACCLASAKSIKGVL